MACGLGAIGAGMYLMLTGDFVAGLGIALAAGAAGYARE
jgi:hypothetical protein